MADEVIKFQLATISEQLAEIKATLKAGHVRMDKHGDEILLLKASKSFANKQMAIFWAVSLLVIAAFLNSYFQAKFTKPKQPVAPIQQEDNK